VSRLLSKDISSDNGFASLRIQSQVLFLMLIPHYTSYGKMRCDGHVCKGTIAPLLSWGTPEIFEDALKDISKHTSVKYFKYKGLGYLKAVKFNEYQKNLRPFRGAKDKLPDYESEIDKAVSFFGKEGCIKITELEIKQKHSEQQLERLWSAFWKEYPNKKDKKRAALIFKKLFDGKNTDETMALSIKIIDAVKNQKTSIQWTKEGGRFIPLPSTFLKGERFNDEEICEIEKRTPMSDAFKIIDKFGEVKEGAKIKNKEISS